MVHRVAARASATPSRLIDGQFQGLSVWQPQTIQESLAEASCKGGGGGHACAPR